MLKDGLSPDTKKEEIIQQWPTPTNHKELQSFLGTVNYLSRFLAFLFDLCAPLQSLLKKDTEFIWMSVHQHAFDQIKLHVSNDVKLQFYNAHEPLYTEVDISKKGIGAVMLQEDTIVRDDSKSGSEIPTYAVRLFQQHSQIILFAITHFKHFTYSRLVHVITDHKLLVSLFRKSLVDSSPRLTRMLVQLLDYIHPGCNLSTWC